MQEAAPKHPPVEGPEEPLEEVRKPETAAPATPAPAPPAPDLKLLERVAALEARERELLDRLARMQADFENFRRRSRDEAAQASARGKTEFVKTMLPVLDNLDRALAHQKDEGLKLLQRQLQAALAESGLQVLDPTGEAFDAKLHEAIAQEAREGAKSGTVVATAEKGYALDGKVLRPARVIVAA